MSPTQWYIAFWLLLAVFFAWWAWRVLYWLDTIALWLKAIGEDIARMRVVKEADAAQVWLTSKFPDISTNRE